MSLYSSVSLWWSVTYAVSTCVLSGWSILPDIVLESGSIPNGVALSANVLIRHWTRATLTGGLQFEHGATGATSACLL